MMVVDPKGVAPIRSTRFVELPRLLHPGDLLVINDTKVFPARLVAKPKGQMTRPIEILLTKRLGVLRWECWCKPGRRLRAGDEIEVSEELVCRVVEKRQDGSFILDFRVPGFESDDASVAESRFWQAIDRVGQAPLPPYIHSDESVEKTRGDYQTVYARHRGAVAAPTAGLHFTEDSLDEVRDRGVSVVRVTLHVGTGTFRPVTVEHVEDHRMDLEEYEIGLEAAECLNRALAENRRIVAVGTTSVRTLESAIRKGAGKIRAGRDETDLFITPGFEFRVVEALLTNFHLPESTLLMLVSAFAGVELIREAYNVAIHERYMFYSFGDCMFVEAGVRR